MNNYASRKENEKNYSFLSLQKKTRSKNGTKKRAKNQILDENSSNNFEDSNDLLKNHQFSLQKPY